MAKRSGAVPGALARAALRFETWRETRTTRRIPAELWTLATRLGARFGVSLTARTLRIGYDALKRRVDAATPAHDESAEAPPAFVEILTEPAAAPSVCVIELANTGGGKMRIELQGAITADLVALSRLFLESPA